MTRPYIEALQQLQVAQRKSALAEMLGGKQKAAPAPAPAPAPKPVERQVEAKTEVQLKELEAARFRYLEAIESLVSHFETKTYDPTEIVDLATMVAEAILKRSLAEDRALLVERVSDALDALDGEQPMRLRLSPMDRQLLAEERPELLARALEIVEDPRIGTGGCIVEGARRAVDATLEGRLERFSRALKQSLIEGRDDVAG